MMARRRDTTWHAEFLRLVKAGLTFKAAVEKLGVSPATLNKHFHADRTFHGKARAHRARRLHGPPPDTSWHPRLPPLLAAGLSTRQAASQLHESPITVRNHLDRFPELRNAVDTALLHAHPAEPPPPDTTRDGPRAAL
ncbi:response regulator transcription factor [Sphaerisporangium album]|uniref:response regulator transcription factor n=1 Tax=Sphaerisporangium album TaxID=509200 RepID=UPI0011C036CA|nr:response regulator transcription factor [Sphaerisporangium album]